MKRKVIRDISLNSVQVIINQLCGLVIFYILSVNLIKSDFGEINWSLAILLTMFNVLSFGIDQAVIKKIATGNKADIMFPAYVIHVFFSGMVGYALLFCCNFLFKDFFQTHHVLLVLGLGKLMVFFSTPFKQLATGMERFRSLLYMSVSSNILRSILLVVFASLDLLGLNNAVIIFIAGDVTELLLCLFIAKYHLRFPVKYRWNKTGYIQLIKESLPLLGSSLFSTIIVRLDWILLGLLSSNIILANYSFAYKVFEVALLPLLVIAPVLLIRFSRIFHEGINIADAKKIYLLRLLKIEIIVACLIALVLNILWVPVIDIVTNNKYGAVNKSVVLLLSACLPVYYFNNFLWTIYLALGEMKKIFYISLVSLIVNLVATAVLILFFNGEGAAAAYFFTLLVQAALFFRYSGIRKFGENRFVFILPLVYAIAGGILADWLFTDTWLILIASLFIYFTCLILTKQLRRDDWQLAVQHNRSEQTT